MSGRGWEKLAVADLAGMGRKRATIAQDAKIDTSARKVPRIDWADVLSGHLRLAKLPEGVRDHVFHPIRKWKMDLAWLDRMIYAECDGGEFSVGRHSRGKGMQSDCEKTNEAALLGWTAYRFTGSQVKSGYALGILEKALKR